MTEIEQLRKEINELRERMTKLENKGMPMQKVVSAHWVHPDQQPHLPPAWPMFTINCGSKV